MFQRGGIVPHSPVDPSPEETVFPRAIDRPSLNQRSCTVNSPIDRPVPVILTRRPEHQDPVFKALTESSLWQVWPKGFGLT